MPAEEIQFAPSPRPRLERWFDRLPKGNKDRRAVLRLLFEEAGCESERLRDLPVRSSRLANLSCTLPGVTTTRVIVGAHFDMTGTGEGAVDNWTGSVLLPALYESLAQTPRRFTFEFVAFTDEERGMVGSNEYVRRMRPEDLKGIVAYINVDSVGLGPLKVSVSRSDKGLLRKTMAVSKALNYPLAGVDVEQVGNSDSFPFFRKKVPVIDFHSITQDTLSFLHGHKDVRAAVDWDSYYSSYRYLSALLAYYDLKLEAGDPGAATARQ